ncbi:hypothetical protein [Rhizobium leucaenae]|uniref:Uncharacterized protein n=1 Tax=Rhizobium leucaenae TaxID=29450 RepID=A0A7W6ZZJ5_9HYPH|nr:hypothetical protein [Rhizobium leucaenae]MBB4571489.1 hypothetical protein [Rhizobium leucaenae]MBB6304810.1 hypothetical protein [Rhizobium leucaenae]
MDVDKAIALISAAGIELTDRRRTDADDGWSLSFSNGAELQISDAGKVKVSGKGAETIARLLDLPAKLRHRASRVRSRPHSDGS